MNPDTGHLVTREKLDSMKVSQQFVDAMTPSTIDNYLPVPPELGRAAKKKLGGHSEATVSLTSGGKLSRWAAGKRKEKRKMQKTSRRKNR